MIGVFIVPTGVGAEIGGHAGDASPAAKLIASCCDILLVHPNVVNASDINEMTENMWYVEGSILDRFLEGSIGLTAPKPNRVLVATNNPLKTVNAVSAARATIGIDAQVMHLETPLGMVGRFNDDGSAGGDVFGVSDLLNQVDKLGYASFDALAIHTPINVSREVALSYYKNGGINPWGGVEAMASRMIADRLNKPVAHAPCELEERRADEELMGIHEEAIIDPRIASEAVSLCYLHCVLKGLHKAPRVSHQGTRVEDVEFLVTPYGCVGRPHVACMTLNIPVICVKENSTCISENIPDSFIVVENYLEAAGVIMGMKSGVTRESVRRPLQNTVIRG